MNSMSRADRERADDGVRNERLVAALKKNWEAEQRSAETYRLLPKLAEAEEEDHLRQYEADAAELAGS